MTVTLVPADMEPVVSEAHAVEGALRTVIVTVPATSANLGPGFDTLGLAVSIYDTLTASSFDDDRLEIEVDGNYVVDTGHIVAFTDGLEYSVGKVGGYKSLFFSGEGLVCKFSGRGRLWLQTRQLGAFASWIHPFRPVKSQSGSDE